MSRRYDGLAVFAALVLGAEHVAHAVEIAPSSTRASAVFFANDVVQSSDHDLDGVPYSSANLSVGASPGAFDGEVASAADPAGIVFGYAAINNNEQPGGSTGRLQADASAGLSYAYTNQTGGLVRLFFDFSFDQFALSAANFQSDGRGDAFATIFIHAYARMNGFSIIANNLLYGATVSDPGGVTSFHQHFNPLVDNALTTMSCADVSIEVMACVGGIRGQLDFGLIAPGDSFELDYSFTGRAHADMVATADSSSGGFVLSHMVPSGAPCLTFCDIARLRAEPSPVVPEPASWAMMIIGFAAGGGLIRRRASARPVFGVI